MQGNGHIQTLLGCQTFAGTSARCIGLAACDMQESWP